MRLHLNLHVNYIYNKVLCKIFYIKQSSQALCNALSTDRETAKRISKFLIRDGHDATRHDATQRDSKFDGDDWRDASRDSVA